MQRIEFARGYHLCHASNLPPTAHFATNNDALEKCFGVCVHNNNNGNKKSLKNKHPNSQLWFKTLLERCLEYHQRH